MTPNEFEQWQERTYARAAPALKLCKWLALTVLAAWAVSLVWVSETNRRRVDCLYNAESVEAWHSCGEPSRLEVLVRALNGALIDF